MDKRSDLETAAEIERAIGLAIPAGARRLYDMGVALETTWRVLLEPEQRRAPGLAAGVEQLPDGRRPSA